MRASSAAVEFLRVPFKQYYIIYRGVGFCVFLFFFLLLSFVPITIYRDRCALIRMSYVVLLGTVIFKYHVTWTVTVRFGVHVPLSYIYYIIFLVIIIVQIYRRKLLNDFSGYEIYEGIHKLNRNFYKPFWIGIPMRCIKNYFAVRVLLLKICSSYKHSLFV